MYFERADGCRLWDLDGREYLDLCCSHGAILLGHGDESVREAVDNAMQRGGTCSYENEVHAEFAEQVCHMIPCMERIRLTGSGTEATMHCIRLARAHTGRSRIVRFEGNFHGYHDQVMFGSDPPGQINPSLEPQSSGVTPGISEQVIQIPYNRADVLRDVFANSGDEIAAVIMEPVWYNAGCIIPDAEFISAVREESTRYGAVLIFDEVLSAFRMGPGGAQEYLAVTPDLCTIGKATGGGFPLSAFGGREEITRRLMPEGDCQHSGTYNGHGVLVAGALAALQRYAEPGFYDHLHAICKLLCDGINNSFDTHGLVGHVKGLGARFGIYMGIVDDVRDYADARRHDREMMLRFIAETNVEGVYFHDYGGVAVHHGFCAAMREEDAREAVERIDRAVQKVVGE